MIAAIEGASAAGKTTWCRSHFPQQTVFEASEDITAPDLYSTPREVATFWVSHAAHQWRRALAIEQEYGLAICDGDPFHLYFSWALWKSGALSTDLFEAERDLYRRCVEAKSVGFVDHVVRLKVPADELRRRAAADRTRRRKRHDMYLSLVPWMETWFDAREKVLPGTVCALNQQLAVHALQPLSGDLRYDTRVLEEMLLRLRT